MLQAIQALETIYVDRMEQWREKGVLREALIEGAATTCRHADVDPDCTAREPSHQKLDEVSGDT